MITKVLKWQTDTSTILLELFDKNKQINTIKSIYLTLYMLEDYEE